MFGEFVWHKWCFQVQPITRCHLPITLYYFEVHIYSINSSKMIDSFHEVLNFNQFFLKLNPFICNLWLVILVHWSQRPPEHSRSPQTFKIEINTHQNGFHNQSQLSKISCPHLHGISLFFPYERNTEQVRMPAPVGPFFRALPVLTPWWFFLVFVLNLGSMTPNYSRRPPELASEAAPCYARRGRIEPPICMV